MEEIRMAVIDDAKALLAIYAPYVQETTVTFEYEVPTLETFKQRIMTALEHFPYYVYVKDGEIVGYAYASFFHPRPAYQWSCELSVYIKQENRHQGIGTKLYDRLENTLRQWGYLNAYACITYPNPASIAFHEKRGYQKAAHYHCCGYKMGQYLDVVWYELFLNEHRVAPAVCQRPNRK